MLNALMRRLDDYICGKILLYSRHLKILTLKNMAKVTIYRFITKIHSRYLRIWIENNMAKATAYKVIDKIQVAIQILFYHFITI